jgi:hypothetical protein
MPIGFLIFLARESKRLSHIARGLTAIASTSILPKVTSEA